MLRVYEALHREARISDLDLEFTRFVATSCGVTAPEVLLASCLVTHLSTAGHTCVELSEFAGGEVLGGEGVAGPGAPALTAWCAALRASPLVGGPDDYRPLILDVHGRLYLYRYWRYEQIVADRLTALAQRRAMVDARALAVTIETLFAGTEGHARDGQREACRVAATQHLCVISGGPGTGKTTTAVRILGLLADANPGLRIALAAPTGKAAARLGDALLAESGGLPEGVRDALPRGAATLHRLLGMRADAARPEYHRDHPLTADLVLVDEASMIDLGLMARLVDALPAHARLVLLGDKDQLASVEAGAVLADLCGPAGAPDSIPETAEGDPPTTSQAGATVGAATRSTARSTIADCVVQLHGSYRFDPRSAIARLARAVRAGDADAALAVLGSGSDTDLLWRRDADRRLLVDGMVDTYAPLLELARGAGPAAEVLAAVGRFQLLCARRETESGVGALNRAIEEELAGRGLARVGFGWYPGRPVMVTRNDYALRLYNGDVGVVLADPDADGALRVCFRTADGAVRWIAPTRMPEHVTAYALTVHKAQGSEFDRVAVVLPRSPSPVLSRELLYTAITRARQRVELWADEAVLRITIARRLRRASGLRDALWGTPE